MASARADDTPMKKNTQNPRYWFFISNRSTRQCIDVVAETAEGACMEVGWQPGECVVITVGEMQRANGRASHGSTFPTLPYP